MIQDTLQGVKIEISAAVIMQTLFGFTPTAYYRFVFVNTLLRDDWADLAREQRCSGAVCVCGRVRFAVGSDSHLQVEGASLEGGTLWGHRIAGVIG